MPRDFGLRVRSDRETGRRVLERLAADPPTRRLPAGSEAPLRDGARVVVLGGGPAGAFFAITLLRETRQLGRAVEVQIIERRKGLALDHSASQELVTPNCGFCAGGISPRMSDILEHLGIHVPPEVVQNRVRSITIQSHWKNIELKVPENRRMISVYRGSRPMAREDRFVNFDSVLLNQAVREGATVIGGEALGVSRSDRGHPVVTYLREGETEEESVEVDFAVFAGGVNWIPGAGPGRSHLAEDLPRMMPGFAPPKIRRTMIFELEISKEFVSRMEGELYFILFGSPDLRLEMGSLMPKGKFVTVVLIGPDIDRGISDRQMLDVVDTFLSLPHVRRILPRRSVRVRPSCICRPNMVVGCATSPIGDGFAVIGDMVTSRLYKDGIYSAYLTGSALAHTIARTGVARPSLRRGYLPLVRRLSADQRSGRNVFLTIGLAFRNPVLSRMTYQAVLRERRTVSKSRRYLESILWRVASGDDTYASILRALLHPMALMSFLGRGVLITVRNLMTELLFGLSWKGFGRFPTGVYREDLDAKVEELGGRLGIDLLAYRDFRRMKSIRIRALSSRIFEELGRLGDRGREFLKPRFVDIHLGSGEPNELGSVIEYATLYRPLALSLVLERFDANRCLTYRVRDGFAKDGVLIIDVDERGPRDCVLSMVVAFNFSSGGGFWRSVSWALHRYLFPTFVHDVLWNHALCKFKDVVERPRRRRPSTPLA